MYLFYKNLKELGRTLDIYNQSGVLHLRVIGIQMIFKISIINIRKQRKDQELQSGAFQQ